MINKNIGSTNIQLIIQSSVSYITLIVTWDMEIVFIVWDWNCKINIVILLILIYHIHIPSIILF